MKIISLLSLLLSFSVLGACQSIRIQKELREVNLEVTGPIEITSYKLVKTSSDFCSIKGKLIDENNEPMFGLTALLRETQIGAICDLDGFFKLDKIPAGSYTLELKYMGMETCTVSIDLEQGDHLEFEAIIALYSNIELLKPIIYLYPEKEMELEIELVYDGKITTTYPKYPVEGWKVTASPDGTITDQNDKEYYALYWEGEPREPLGIRDGFVVSKEQTIPFLEEKLALLGLNARESNEFIIFWLPILEKNNFNLIHFASDDYLEQAQLNISPIPETIIRVAMVFQGLDDEIEFPVQDLASLIKTRSGFTVVEWGGQELPKTYKLAVR